MQKVLIQAEKNRQDKYAQAMKINIGDKALMQTIASMLWLLIKCTSWMYTSTMLVTEKSSLDPFSPNE